MENKKKNNLYFYIIISLGCIIFFIYIGVRIYKRHNLHSSYIEATGEVYEVTGTWKGVSIVKYKIKYNSKLFYSSDEFLLNNEGATKVLNKEFLVVFSPNDSTLTDILMCPCDFEKYNIPFPDSLSWVKEYCLK